MVLRLAIVPVITLALALAACSDDGPPAADAGQQGPVADGPSIYGPLQETRQAGLDYLTAQTAVNRQLDAAWARCMEGKGYHLPPPSPTREQVLTDGYHIAYGTDIADPAVRTREGYGITSRLVGITSVYTRPNAVGEFVKNLPDAQRNGFDAVLEACSDQAHTEVLPTADLTALDDAGQDIAAKVDVDPRVLAARAAWAGCMKAAGYPYQRADDVADALDARAKPLYRALRPGVVTPAAQALHAEELRTAAQDWTCRKTTITPAFVSVRNELEGAFLDKNPDLGDRVWQKMAEVIARG